MSKVAQVDFGSLPRPLYLSDFLSNNLCFGQTVRQFKIKRAQVDLGLLPPAVLLQARQPPREADIAPALRDMQRLLGQTPSPNAADDAARLVSDILADVTDDGPLPGALAAA